MSGSKLHSWGHYPPHPQAPHTVFWRDDISDKLSMMLRSPGTTLPYGNGRSYGDSCLSASDHVMHMRPLNRFIGADWQTGVVAAEAGVTLEEVLSLAVPRGWFLPVTPGTKYVTLGGAIANDVHGKNHHVRGTFGRHVRRFGMVRSDRPPAVCSPDENAQLFSATIGGLGLTGVVAWAELQLMPIRSNKISTTTVRFESLNEFFALSSEFDQSHEYTVAWVDCLATGKAMGRGVFIAGDHAREGTLDVSDKTKLSIPLTPPISAITPSTLRVFNTLYFHRHKKGRHTGIADYDPFFYPLDGILHWNRIYGARGFQQYQCVIPDMQAENAVGALLNAIAGSGSGSFLAVLKRCGNIASPGLMSFPLPGVSLALDFPQHPQLSAALFPRLDAIVRDAGGRLYPAKDAHMSGVDFRTAYPNWQKVEAMRDPALCSRFWKRVTHV